MTLSILCSEYHYAQCYNLCIVMLNVIMLCVVLLSVVVLNVFMLSVVAPFVVLLKSYLDTQQTHLCGLYHKTVACTIKHFMVVIYGFS
jgi:hypothetical protein